MKKDLNHLLENGFIINTLGFSFHMNIFGKKTKDIYRSEKNLYFKILSKLMKFLLINLLRKRFSILI